MKVVFKVMSEDSLKRQSQKQEEEKEDEGREVFRINSEVRPMMDSAEAIGNGEEGRRKDTTTRGRRRKERRGRQREGVMRREEEEKEEKEEEVKERRSEWRREEPLAKPSLTGGAALEKAPFASFALLFLVIIALPL